MSGWETAGVRRPVIPALIAALSGLVLTGCSGGDGWQVREAGDLLVLIGPGSDGGDSAQLVGEIVAVDGCLGVMSDEGETYVVGWPSTTSIASDDPPQIRPDGDAKLGVGDPIALGGGGHSPARSRTLRCRHPARTPGCSSLSPRPSRGSDAGHGEERVIFDPTCRVSA